MLRAGALVGTASPRRYYGVPAWFVLVNEPGHPGVPGPTLPLWVAPVSQFRDGRHPMPGQAPAAACLASDSQVSTTVSGLSDIDSMPWSISHSARSGWSEGP